MRILHIIPQLAVGGTQRIVADLMRSQRVTDEPTLCVLGYGNKNAANFGATADRFLGFSGSLRDMQGITRCLDGLHETVRDIRPTIIHAHLWPAALFAAPIAVEAGIECVVHIHDSQPWLASERVRDVVLRTVHRRILAAPSVQFIAVCRAVKDYTVHNLPCSTDRIRVVPNGVNVSNFRRMQDHSQNGKVPTVGSVGRLEPEKGFAHLIKAAWELRRRGCHFRLLIAGEGSQRAVLEALISEFGLTDIVRFIGVARDVQSFYDQLDIFVLPSIAAEGLPLTILEAMAMELPVIATAIAGVPEVIGTDEIYGRLVSPADSVALANAIQEMIENRGLRNAIGQRAKTRVESHFTVERMAGQIREVYQEMV